MSGPGFRFDEVGDWSVLKLDIIEQYGGAYTKAFNGRGRQLKKYYIDGFSGAGVHVVKRTRQQIEGSPARALKITPPFDGFYFIDLDKDKAAYLEKQCAGRSNVTIINDDANTYLRTVLPTIQYKLFNRALCVLDPYGLHLDWDVIEMAGKSGAVDLFLNFPVMDMNRNAIWRTPDRASADGIERMSRFWGDETWKQAAYAKSRQMGLFAEPDDEKQPNSAIVAAFRERLNNVAGFEFVPEPMPMVNSKKAVVYYLFFASPKPAAKAIITDIFEKHRSPGRRLTSPAATT
jgi:three-Cys-motif partner protein